VAETTVIAGQAPAGQTDLVAEVEALTSRIARVRDAVGQVIFGQPEVVDQTLITLLAGGRTTQAELRAEGDRLLARGVQLDRGARLVAVIRDAQGRPITVRFVVP